jgi:hypothetical protein
MGIFSVGPCRRRGRAVRGLFFLLLLFLSSMIACGVFTPKKTHREDILKRDVRSFHWAMMGQDVPVALRYVEADDREAWDDAFTRLFEQLRLLDYRVSLVKFAEESSEATVRVRWTAHPPDSLVVKEMRWKEEWVFDLKKQRWSLQPGPDALKGLPEDCLPALPENESPDEDKSAE